MAYMECSTQDRVFFAAELEFPKILVPRLSQNSWTVLAIDQKYLSIYQNEPIKVQIFRLMTACMKINQILNVIFETSSQFFFKYCITLQCNDA